jgi:pyruvate dehydrogenase E1 component
MTDIHADVDLTVLDEIQQRVLWLAVRMVDVANRDRDAGGIKVGGHQASSASMVSIMTSLWFDHLGGNDKVAVKPHASPVYHAIKYLTGELDRSYLTRLRQLGGLQAYPSRTKDPDVADFSTGSVGLGVVAPLFAATVRRYVDAHFGERPSSRFIALVGDAELDEGNVWEAIADAATAGLGNVTWIVDLNRQSLDRVVPALKALRLQRFFADSGWQVIEAKYGRQLEGAFADCEPLRAHIDDMSNERYQSLFALRGTALRERFTSDADAAVARWAQSLDDATLASSVLNLGGHDLDVLRSAYRASDSDPDRPSVVFAYTVKGWGLPMAGDPHNHAALLPPEQVDAFRQRVGLDVAHEWDRFDPESAAGRVCGSTGRELNNTPPPPRAVVAVPAGVGALTSKPVSTQETFGRLLTSLATLPDVAKRMVTTSPDVSISTNLGGWINKVGVFAPTVEPDYLGDARLLRWQQGPTGQHIELGISEMNLFLLLGMLGLSHEHHGETLLPIGTVYDPFVCRGLDAFIYATYNAARFVVVGTPAGVTLAPEGGAHQSTITASIGMELPGVTYCEPAFATALDWMLCNALNAVAADDGGSTYLRLSTRPIDQSPFERLRAAVGDDALRADVLAGGYVVRDGVERSGPAVVLATCGPVVTEVLAVADLLEGEGVTAHVIDLTSPDRLYADWRSSAMQAARLGRTERRHHHLSTLIPPSLRSCPIVTVHDAASHALAWLGSVFGQRTIPVGVDVFGQSGSIADLYKVMDLTPDHITNTALLSLHG